MCFGIEVNAGACAMHIHVYVWVLEFTCTGVLTTNALTATILLRGAVQAAPAELQPSSSAAAMPCQLIGLLPSQRACIPLSYLDNISHRLHCETANMPRSAAR